MHLFQLEWVGPVTGVLRDHTNNMITTLCLLSSQMSSRIEQITAQPRQAWQQQNTSIFHHWHWNANDEMRSIFISNDDDNQDIKICHTASVADINHVFVKGNWTRGIMARNLIQLLNTITLIINSLGSKSCPRTHYRTSLSKSSRLLNS